MCRAAESNQQAARPPSQGVSGWGSRSFTSGYPSSDRNRRAVKLLRRKGFRAVRLEDGPKPVDTCTEGLFGSHGACEPMVPDCVRVDPRQSPGPTDDRNCDGFARPLWADFMHGDGDRRCHQGPGRPATVARAKEVARPTGRVMLLDDTQAGDECVLSNLAHFEHLPFEHVRPGSFG